LAHLVISLRRGNSVAFGVKADIDRSGTRGVRRVDDAGGDEKDVIAMNYNQRRLVVMAFVVVGLVLAFLFLRFADQPEGQVETILLGVVVPLCLFATGAFIALGRRN
jgi:hypothetical protein